MIGIDARWGEPELWRARERCRSRPPDLHRKDSGSAGGQADRIPICLVTQALGYPDDAGPCGLRRRPQRIDLSLRGVTFVRE